MIPVLGAIVHYRLSANNVQQIHKQRRLQRYLTGNSVSEGDVYPLIITRVWGADRTGTCRVNGQVFLDGNDTLWVTSAPEAGFTRVLNGAWFDPHNE